MNDSKLATLCPVADAGFRRAGQGLSEMAGTDIAATATRIRRLPLAKVPDLLGGPGVVVATVYLAIKGDVEGHMVLMMPLSEACALADMLLELPSGSTRELDGLASSALGEVGNLVGSFFLAALADVTSLRLSPTPPTIIADMSGAVLDAVLADLSMESDQVLIIDTLFAQSSRRVSACFLVLPRERYLELILGRLPR